MMMLSTTMEKNDPSHDMMSQIVCDHTSIHWKGDKYKIVSFAFSISISFPPH
jgi:hemoglobin-like flavoprotein